jgi:hypothetical protein
MDLEPKPSQADSELGFAEPPVRKPFEILRDTERSLREKTVSAIVPIAPDLAGDIEQASRKADRTLETLANIDLDQITDEELRPARILMGLTFVGISSLMLLFLALFFSTMHPELTALGQIHEFWHPYVWFISLGVAGLTMLGREAMRITLTSHDDSEITKSK